MPTTSQHTDSKSAGSLGSEQLSQSVTALKGVGVALAEKLTKLHISTVEDLLFHLPSRYQDRTRVTPIGAVRRGDEAVVVGQVSLSEVIKGRRQTLIVRLQDGTGSITLRFFHFNTTQKKQFQKGALVRCYGEARPGASGLELYHPEYSLVAQDQPVAVEDHLTPIYPLTEGLTQNRLRQLIHLALAELKKAQVADWLPKSLFPNLPSLKESLFLLHEPPPDAPVFELQEYKHPSQHRLIIEELIAQQLSLLKLRQQHKHHRAPVFNGTGNLSKRMLDQLPFSLTGAQNRVIGEIQQDIQQASPMLRLVQGDVGSGKTLVAAMAALNAIEAGYQVAVMAPTEILAEQHFNNFTQWFTPLGLDVAWMAGKPKGKAAQNKEGPATRNLARALISEGYKIPRGKGKGSKRPSIKWITNNLSINQAGFLLRELKGSSGKSTWKIDLPARSFLGQTVAEQKEQLHSTEALLAETQAALRSKERSIAALEREHVRLRSKSTTLSKEMRVNQNQTEHAQKNLVRLGAREEGLRQGAKGGRIVTRKRPGSRLRSRL